MYCAVRRRTVSGDAERRRMRGVKELLSCIEPPRVVHHTATPRGERGI